MTTDCISALSILQAPLPLFMAFVVLNAMTYNASLLFTIVCDCKSESFIIECLSPYSLIVFCQVYGGILLVPKYSIVDW